jgi:hypothetical protein
MLWFFFLLGYFAMNSMFKLTEEGVSRWTTIADKVFHAHYTAGLLEDEIRRIRNEDYAYRKKYDELKKEATS